MSLPVSTNKQKGDNMQFMVIFNYEPQNRDEIVKRRMEKGALIPEGGEYTRRAGKQKGHTLDKICLLR